ncbi:TPA: hypothetical protein NJ595_001035 [Vibrio parahaemolyticus]|nr:hypothetical protein [Vibrio parahaemolyticus]
MKLCPSVSDALSVSEAAQLVLDLNYTMIEADKDMGIGKQRFYRDEKHCQHGEDPVCQTPKNGITENVDIPTNLSWQFSDTAPNQVLISDVYLGRSALDVSCCCHRSIRKKAN